MEEILTTTISIPINKLNKQNIDGIIRNKMKSLYENKCNSSGFVLKDSIMIINRSIGKIITTHSISSVNYDVTYKSLILIPCKGDEYDCYVDSITKMGIIAYVKGYKTDDEEESLQNSPLLIIIPRDYIDPSIDISEYSNDQKLKIRVLDSRSRYNSKQIQIVGELI